MVVSESIIGKQQACLGPKTKTRLTSTLISRGDDSTVCRYLRALKSNDDEMPMPAVAHP